MKKLVTKFMKLEWYYQLFIALISFVSLALLIKFLLWIVPFVFGFLMLMWIFTNGEIFSLPWQRYKQRNQTSDNLLYEKLYHWLTEEGVTELPISTLNFTQGIEEDKPDTYFVHILSLIHI